MSKELVFLTGAGGYIALHIIDHLLKRNFRVLGSVTSKDEGENIIKNFGNKYGTTPDFTYEVVKDISVNNCFDAIFQSHKDIIYVLHTVSPVQFNTGKSIEDAFINPAITGTHNVLNAAYKYGPQIKKIVHTSSFGAIRNAMTDPKVFVHTEESWNPITLPMAEALEKKMAGTRTSGLVGYSASKTFAEKAAWDFIEKNKPQFTLTTVNPPFVFGPQMFDDVVKENRMNASVELVTDLLKSKTPDNDKDPFAFASISIDVRDCALLHVVALERDLAGNRLFPIQGEFSEQSMLNIINDNIPQLRGEIAVGNRDATESIAKTIILYDNSKTRKLTEGIELIPLEKTVVDTVNQIIDAGTLSKFSSSKI